METWKPVAGWENFYEVSDRGHVRSVDRVTKQGDHFVSLRGVDRCLTTHKSGHRTVSLRRPGIQKTFYVHRLVLEAFVGPCPEGMEACHGNGDPGDNRIENLRWDTRFANVHDMLGHGNHHNIAKTHCKRNHPLSGENLRMEGGRRRCRACAALAIERWKSRQ